LLAIHPEHQAAAAVAERAQPPAIETLYELLTRIEHTFDDMAMYFLFVLTVDIKTV